MVAAAHLQAASILGYVVKWGGLFGPTKIHEGCDYTGGWDYPHIQMKGV